MGREGEETRGQTRKAGMATRKRRLARDCGSGRSWERCDEFSAVVRFVYLRIWRAVSRMARAGGRGTCCSARRSGIARPSQRVANDCPVPESVGPSVGLLPLKGRSSPWEYIAFYRTPRRPPALPSSRASGVRVRVGKLGKQDEQRPAYIQTLYGS